MPQVNKRSYNGDKLFPASEVVTEPEATSVLCHVSTMLWIGWITHLRTYECSQLEANLQLLNTKKRYEMSELHLWDSR